MNQLHRVAEQYSLAIIRVAVSFMLQLLNVIVQTEAGDCNSSITLNSLILLSILYIHIYCG